MTLKLELNADVVTGLLEDKKNANKVCTERWVSNSVKVHMRKESGRLNMCDKRLALSADASMKVPKAENKLEDC
jgi:hypothetical protein